MTLRLTDLVRLRKYLAVVLAVPLAERPAGSLVLDAIRADTPALYAELLGLVHDLDARVVLATLPKLLSVSAHDRPWIEALVATLTDRAAIVTVGPEKKS